MSELVIVFVSFTVDSSINLVDRFLEKKFIFEYNVGFVHSLYLHHPSSSPSLILGSPWILESYRLGLRDSLGDGTTFTLFPRSLLLEGFLCTDQSRLGPNLRFNEWTKECFGSRIYRLQSYGTKLPEKYGL